ncbi:hypothetical protein Baya_13948 [Bagarius yarrelli]|uniref:Uncharacterized protein n=1 Tax=Bagarius yarrelli TaxID=175774 RepID=A0A556V7D9_BAGYA|nr:hypothetical protein Baya_13948 [Bagarius yarrelli]
MGQNYSTEVEAVVVPLKDAICSLNEVYQALSKADVDPLTGQCSNYDYIRQQIVEAHQHLEQSERAASSGLESLNRNLESLVEDEGKLEREMNETQQTLENLRTEQTSNEELLREANESVLLAGKHLDSANQTLQDQENRKHHAEVIKDVGAGLLVIPIIGWISAMMIDGAVELDVANQAVRVAEDEVRKSESELEKYKNKVSDYKSKIFQTECDISQKDWELRQTREVIQQVKQQMESVGEFQNKLRSAVNLLGLLSGKVSVVEHQTRKSILQMPIMKVMEDVMNAMMKITGNELLYGEDMFRLVQQIKANERRLKAV